MLVGENINKKMRGGGDFTFRGWQFQLPSFMQKRKDSSDERVESHTRGG